MRSVTQPTDVEAYLAEAKKRRQQFIELIRAQERLATANPAAYRRRVLWMAYLGYAYIVGVLILTVLAMVGLLWLMVVAHRLNAAIIRVFIVLVPVVWVVLRSLFVKISPPDGVRLERSDAPELYREVDAVSSVLKAPKVDAIIIDERLNAAAAQVPRFGFFGPARNYLILGLPLLLTLSPDEARSVIGHEFGHFSGQHGRFGGWIYRLNRTWELIQMRLNQNGGNFLFTPFFNWFEPRFDATSFALRRTNEYEADAAAVQVAGADAAARALMRFSYAVPHLRKAFWTPLYERAKTEPEPPINPLARLPIAGREPVEVGFVLTKLQARLAETTGYADTHPSLTDRLRAMGKLPQDVRREAENLANGIPTSAAEAFLGDRLKKVMEEVSKTAIESMSEGWKRYHDQHVQQAKALADLREKLAHAPPTPSEEISLALLTSDVEGRGSALPLLRTTADKYPEDGKLRYALGNALLDIEDDSGVTHLEEARRLRPDLASQVLAKLSQYYAERAETETVETLQEQQHEAAVLDHLARQESRRLNLADTFGPTGFRPDQVEDMRRQLQGRKDILVAYFVGKVIASRPEKPQAMLIAFPSKKLIEKGDERAKLVQVLVKELKYPGSVMVFSPQDRKAWQRRLASMPEACLVDREND